nr:MAG TPA: hypothetical protein [Bacteriophage sp.]
MVIFDFIKSWFFYPKLKSYFENYWGIEFHMSRIQYSWWHCHVGKLK